MERFYCTARAGDHGDDACPCDTFTVRANVGYDKCKPRADPTAVEMAHPSLSRHLFSFHECSSSRRTLRTVSCIVIRPVD